MRSIISKWPKVVDLARDAGVRRGTAQEWKNNGSIPGQYDTCIVAGAERRGIEGVTFESLARARRAQYEARRSKKGVVSDDSCASPV